MHERQVPHTAVRSAQCGDMSTLSSPHSSLSAGRGSVANTSKPAPRMRRDLRAASSVGRT
eukprot:scaffold63090_cov21-Tisochrysis_lutea.AAC.1